VPAEVPDKPPQVAAPANPHEAVSPAKQAVRGRASGRQEISAKAPARSEAGTASRPAVKISAIVWQEEPSERKAMINGRVARQGETVDGMRILEIQPSRVKLSFEGEPFTVGMFD
jgi:hypothetical protein